MLIEKRYILFFSGLFLNPQKETGGIKRFRELAEYVCTHIPESIICSQDEWEEITKNGICNFIKLEEIEGNKRYLPEANLAFVNRHILKQIKKTIYSDLIIFDVPTATGPLLYGLKNVVLMIRKDMIGYEKVQNKGKTKWLKIFFQWICESICMFKAKMIITQCVYDKEVLKNRHPLISNFIEKKTRVQINNVNPSWIVNKSKISDFPEYLLSPKKEFRVCFIGGFGSPRKGQDLFLKAAVKILHTAQDVEFILIGGGRNIEKYKEDYNNKHICFIGRLENPIAILKECDLLVVPSYADSCPNTIMEALYNEIPVIGSNAGGIPEILLNENALFELNVDSLEKMILKYKDDKKALLELKEQQKERKEELTFDWAPKIIEIINKYK